MCRYKSAGCTERVAATASAQCLAAALSLVITVVGCGPRPAPPASRTTEHTGEKEAYWPSGVRSPDAPNLTLSYWFLSDKPRLPRTELTAELANVLANDTGNAIDLFEFSLTDDLRTRVKRLRRVEWLRLPTDARGADLQWLGEMRQLRGISLAHAELTGVDFRSLRQLSNLQWLNLYHTSMASRDFMTLPRFESLQVLLLGGEMVTDDYLLHLARITLPSLVSLDVYHAPNVTDVGVDHICSVYRLENLDLFLAERVTERSVESIARMSALRSLGIGGTGICPDHRMNDAVARLKRLLPNTVVDYGD